jgi:hypothetical protein
MLKVKIFKGFSIAIFVFWLVVGVIMGSECTRDFIGNADAWPAGKFNVVAMIICWLIGIFTGMLFYMLSEIIEELKKNK